MAASTHIDQVDNDAAQAAAAGFSRHIRICGRCNLLSERLCRTGRALRNEKYRTVMQRWRR